MELLWLLKLMLMNVPVAVSANPNALQHVLQKSAEGLEKLMKANVPAADYVPMFARLSAYWNLKVYFIICSFQLLPLSIEV